MKNITISINNSGNVEVPGIGQVRRHKTLGRYTVSSVIFLEDKSAWLVTAVV